MENFAHQLRRRLDDAIPHGSSKKVALYVGVHPNEVSRWGTLVRGRWQVPDLLEIARAAEMLKVSPCWLAFERGARDEVEAAYGLRLGKECELDPELARLVLTYLQAPEAEKEVPRAWARSKQPRFTLEVDLQAREEERRYAQARKTKQVGKTGRARGESPAHVREEIENAVARLRVLESGTELSDRSKELLRSAAARLLALVPVRASEGRVGRTAKAPGAGGTSRSIAPSGGKPSSSAPSRVAGPSGKKRGRHP